MEFDYLNMALLALAVFFATGVVVLLRQGVKGPAVVTGLLAALSLLAGVMRL